MEQGRSVQDFTAQYEKVYRDMYRFALYSLGNPQDAEDVVSDAVLDAYAGFGRLRELGAFKAWIFKILTAKCKRKLKEYAGRGKTVSEEEQGEMPAVGMDFADAAAVRQAFGRLDQQERMIISMHLFGGYSSREIGKLLHMKDGTVRSRQSRALEKMRDWLEG